MWYVIEAVLALVAVVVAFIGGILIGIGGLLIGGLLVGGGWYLYDNYDLQFAISPVVAQAPVATPTSPVSSINWEALIEKASQGYEVTVEF